MDFGGYRIPRLEVVPHQRYRPGLNPPPFPATFRVPTHASFPLGQRTMYHERAFPEIQAALEEIREGQVPPEDHIHRIRRGAYAPDRNRFLAVARFEVELAALNYRINDQRSPRQVGNGRTFFVDTVRKLACPEKQWLLEEFYRQDQSLLMQMIADPSPEGFGHRERHLHGSHFDYAFSRAYMVCWQLRLVDLTYAELFAFKIVPPNMLIVLGALLTTKIRQADRIPDFSTAEPSREIRHSVGRDPWTERHAIWLRFLQEAATFWKSYLESCNVMGWIPFEWPFAHPTDREVMRGIRNRFPRLRTWPGEFDEHSKRVWILERPLMVGEREYEHLGVSILQYLNRAETKHRTARAPRISGIEPHRRRIRLVETWEPEPEEQAFAYYLRYVYWSLTDPRADVDVSEFNRVPFYTRRIHEGMGNPRITDFYRGLLDEMVRQREERLSSADLICEFLQRQNVGRFIDLGDREELERPDVQRENVEDIRDRNVGVPNPFVSRMADRNREAIQARRIAEQTSPVTREDMIPHAESSAAAANRRRRQRPTRDLHEEIPHAESSGTAANRGQRRRDAGIEVEVPALVKREPSVVGVSSPVKEEEAKIEEEPVVIDITGDSPPPRRETDPDLEVVSVTGPSGTDQPRWTARSSRRRSSGAGTATAPEMPSTTEGRSPETAITTASEMHQYRVSAIQRSLIAQAMEDRHRQQSARLREQQDQEMPDLLSFEEAVQPPGVGERPADTEMSEPPEERGPQGDDPSGQPARRL